jgi:hypothetical protein
VEDKILKRIEVLRGRLNKFGMNRNLIDPKVVELSQELDRLLNQYQNTIRYQQLSFW